MLYRASTFCQLGLRKRLASRKRLIPRYSAPQRATRACRPPPPPQPSMVSFFRLDAEVQMRIFDMLDLKDR